MRDIEGIGGGEGGEWGLKQMNDTDDRSHCIL